MHTRNLHLVSVEYSELGENIRATWRYISDLIKMWIAYQVGAILIVLVCTHLYERQIGEPLKFLIVVWIFSILSVLFSFGAAKQNSRLFTSAESFVVRGNFIEEEFGFLDTSDKTTRSPSSQYAYMRNELYQFDRLNLSKILSFIYCTIGIFWLVFAIGYSLYILNAKQLLILP